jgi:hypothetical protein
LCCRIVPSLFANHCSYVTTHTLTQHLVTSVLTKYSPFSLYHALQPAQYALRLLSRFDLLWAISYNFSLIENQCAIMDDMANTSQIVFKALSTACAIFYMVSIHSEWYHVVYEDTTISLVDISIWTSLD